MTVFITGTSTGIGKTVVTGLIARELRRRNHTVITQKWVQTGCEGFPEDLDTHLKLMELSRDSTKPYHAAMNPYCFSLPASPHLAAEHAGTTINPAKLTTATQALQRHFNHVLIEGAGGIMVPLTPHFTLLDLVDHMKLPTLVVVKNELGCINHALLTLTALAERHIPILGIIMNTTHSDTPSDILADNPNTISRLSGVPVLAELSYMTSPATETVDLSNVLSVLV